MPSTVSFLHFVLDQLSGVDGVTWRPMMGEFILYVNGRVFGGVYDDRLLVKPVPAVLALLPDGKREKPYEGAKEMLLVENTDDRDFLSALVRAAEPELPASRSPRDKGKRAGG